MFRPSSAAGQDVSSFVRHPVFSEYVCVCVCVCVCVREREREREKSFIKEREKLWCGSCAVWMFRPSSAVKMFRLSSGTPCLVSREREELYKRERKALVWVLCCLDVSSIVSSRSRCFVFRQAPRV